MIKTDTRPSQKEIDVPSVVFFPDYILKNVLLSSSGGMFVLILIMCWPSSGTIPNLEQNSVASLHSVTAFVPSIVLVLSVVIP